MMARGLSAKTTRNTGLVLHRAIEQARRWGLLPLNVCSLVDLPRLTRPETQALTAEEAQRVREAARGDDLEALWVMLLTTGLRQGEAIAFQWSAIDLEAGGRPVPAPEYRIAGARPRPDEPRIAKAPRT